MINLPPIPQAVLDAAGSHRDTDIEYDIVQAAYPHIFITALEWAAELIIPIEGEAWLTQQAERIKKEIII